MRAQQRINGMMDDVLGMLMLVGALVLAVPVATLLSQVLLGVSGRPRHLPVDGPRPRLAVLIPAHNEAQGLPPTLANVLEQLLPGDRCLVVADNCSDTTAEVARACGAEVTERCNAVQRGKGYALDHGLKELLRTGDAVEVVIVVDADCLLEPQALDRLARACASSGRPVQADYRMGLPEPLPEASLKRRFAAFAWAVKNSLRPSGASRVHAPCILMGTGMAFPIDALRGVSLASGNIVEDVKLGIDLALQGLAPKYLPAAVVHSQFPRDDAARAVQRQRWEHGHLATLLAELPRLLGQALWRRDAELLALALDLAVPPLALLSLLCVLSLLVDSGMLALGWGGALTAWAWGLSLAACLLILTAILAAWSAVGRPLLKGRELAAVPFYVLGKLMVYLRFVIRRQSEWVRARRDHE